MSWLLDKGERAMKCLKDDCDGKLRLVDRQDNSDVYICQSCKKLWIIAETSASRLVWNPFS